MEKKDLIKGIKDFLELENFKVNSTGAGVVRLDNEFNEIVFPYKKYPGVFVLAPYVSCNKSFPEVESILEPFYKKYNLGYQPYTIYKSSRRFEHLSTIDLYTVEDIQKVGFELKTMVYEDILPFFEQYQNIASVLIHMESLAKEDVSKFICHSPVPRMMVLKKIGGSKDWIQFCEWAVDIYKSMSLDSKDDHNNYELICDLYNKLKTI